MKSPEKRKADAGLFEALTGVEAACRDLGTRGILRLEGADRVRFLNGMVSNDVAALASGESCYATILDRKGHLLTDVVVLALADAFILDTAAGRLRNFAPAYVVVIISSLCNDYSVEVITCARRRRMP